MRAARQAVAKSHAWELQVLSIAMTLAHSVAPELLAAVPPLSSSSEQEGWAVRSGDPHPGLTTELDTLFCPQDSLESKKIHQSGESATKAATPIGPVLLVSPWYRPAVGGVAEVAERLHRSFTQAGVETHLLIAHEGHGDLQADPSVPKLWRWAAPSSAFDRLNFKTLLGTLARGAVACWRLNQFVRSQKIQTILLIYPIGYAWPFLLLRRVNDVRIIASLHGNDVTKFNTYQAPLRWLIRRVLQSSDAIIACAKHLETKAQEICSDKTLNIHLIPNCVDGTHFVPPPNLIRSDSRPTFVHVSNFASKKRTIDIIEAFGEKRISSNARLIMVGDGRDRVAATDRARSLGISHRVEFVGLQRDIRPFLWQADAFILASDDEGAPLVLLEAMACGLPCVLTEIGGANEMIKNGLNGYLCKPDDQDIALKWSEALHNQFSAQTIHDYTRQNFSAERMTSEYKQFLLFNSPN